MYTFQWVFLDREKTTHVVTQRCSRVAIANMDDEDVFQSVAEMLQTLKTRVHFAMWLNAMFFFRSLWRDNASYRKRESHTLRSSQSQHKRAIFRFQNKTFRLFVLVLITKNIVRNLSSQPDWVSIEALRPFIRHAVCSLNTCVLVSTRLCFNK